ncbi:hypothetical protein BHE74_00008131 [Ensete ventricosum]|nr:hypothetical protein BHE74_00008131 [Ensete ventricosum]
MDIPRLRGTAYLGILGYDDHGRCGMEDTFTFHYSIIKAALLHEIGLHKLEPVLCTNQLPQMGQFLMVPCKSVIVNAVEVGGAQPKKRTFRKFSYRGVDLDQLLDMGLDELVKLFDARALRRFRSILSRFHRIFRLSLSND